MRRWIAAALAAAALSGCELEAPSIGGEDGQRQGARVVRAVDGDTIEVKSGSREEIVRLLGGLSRVSFGGPPPSSLRPPSEEAGGVSGFVCC